MNNETSETSENAETLFFKSLRACELGWSPAGVERAREAQMWQLGTTRQ